MSINEAFNKIPGSPIAYWVNDRSCTMPMYLVFSSFVYFCDAKEGVGTRDDQAFFKIHLGSF